MRPVRKAEVDTVKAVLDTVFQGLWGISFSEVQAQYDPMYDIEHIQSYYAENEGVFLVIADGERIIGTGGIGHLDAETAELTRIFLLQEYRGRGLGRRLVVSLLQYAHDRGYQKIRLKVVTPDLQPEAVGLYSRLGFYPLQNDSKNSIELQMEFDFSRGESQKICSRYKS